MGCDIHLAAEVFDEIKREWVHVPGPIRECWACDGTGLTTRGNNVGKPCDWCAMEPRYYEDEPDYVDWHFVGIPGQRRESWFDDRSYNVFSLLADVRNAREPGYMDLLWSGLGPYAEDDYIVPISPPRGLPEDITNETRHILSNEHSQTWLDLFEVITHDWDTPHVQRGMISPEQFEALQRGERPQSWCAATSDSSAVMGAWTIPHREFGERFLVRMKELLMVTGEHRCRLVMDFDS